MAVKARFYIASMTKRARVGMAGYSEPQPLGEVIMFPVARGEENREWASATPAGKFEMTLRGGAVEWFETRLGKEVSITIEED